MTKTDKDKLQAIVNYLQSDDWSGALTFLGLSVPDIDPFFLNFDTYNDTHAVEMLVSKVDAIDDPTQRQQTLGYITAKLQPIFDAISEATDRKTMFINIKKLAYLTALDKHIPQIIIAQAQIAIYVQQEKDKKQSPEADLRFRREIDMWHMELHKEDLPKLPTLQSTAQPLQACIESLDTESPLYLNAVTTLAYNWLLQKKANAAATLGKILLDHDLPPSEPPLKAIAEAVLDSISQTIIDLLRNNQLDDAHALIEPLQSLTNITQLQLHYADWLFLNRDFEAALTQYDQCWKQSKPRTPEPKPKPKRDPFRGLFSSGNDDKPNEPEAELPPPPTLDDAGIIMALDLGDKIQAIDTPKNDDEQDPVLPVEIMQLDFSIAWQRAVAGLVMCYQETGGHEEAQKFLLDLLNHLSKENDKFDKSVMLNMLDNMQSNMQKKILNTHISARKTAYDAGDFATAEQHALELTMKSNSVLEHEAWLALILARQNRTSLEAITHLLSRQTHESLSHISHEEQRFLMDYLVEQQAWQLINTLMPIVNLDETWQETHAQNIRLYVEREIQTIRQHVAAHQMSTARRKIKLLLDIAPNNANILMLQAEIEAAYLNNGMARMILRDIIERFPDMADIAKRLLNKIGDGQGSTLTENGHRPYIHVYQTDGTVPPDSLIYQEGGNTWNATFAVRLHSVYLTETLPSIHYQTAELLIGLHRGELYLTQPHFSWRYLAQDGKLTVALLCRVSSFQRQLAEHEALRLWETVSEMLPLQREKIYYFEPVTNEGALKYLLNPFPVNEAASLVRREQEISNQYHIGELTSGNSSLHRSLQLLLSQTSGAMLDVFFQPTEIYAWEKDRITPAFSTYREGERPPELPDSGNVLLDFAQTMQREAARNQQAQVLRRLEELPYLVQIRLATFAPLPAALPEWVGLDLFGLTHFEVLKTVTEDEVNIFRRNLQDISGERYGFTAAPEGMERLRYLFTPVETVNAVRLPVPGVDGLPGMPLQKVRLEPLPNPLPENGVVIGESLMPIRGQFPPIRLDDVDRTRHVYIVGRTGTGKSMLIQNMALQDIEAGRGVGVIDPHGDLVERILERIPPHRYGDVVYFDPSDEDKPIGLNIMDISGTYEQSIVTSDFIALMYSMFDPNRTGMVGPRFENAVRNAMMMAMEIEGTTFIEVVRILTDDKYREKCVAEIEDPIVRSYWEETAKNFRRFGEGEMIDYVTSKFGRFVNDPLMRNIIGQGHNSLNFEKIMNEGKILLVNLSKGRMGGENSRFLGLLLVPQLFVAALKRARIPEAERHLFCLYVDEFHNFTTPTFSTILSEARKYGVALTIANQFISQVDPNIRESVFGNVGSLLTFRLGIRDAQFIAPELFPVFTERDVINLPNYHLLAKMLVSGDTAPAFPVRTRLDERKVQRQVAQKLHQTSQQQYGRDMQMVKQEILNRFHHPPKRRNLH